MLRGVGGCHLMFYAFVYTKFKKLFGIEFTSPIIRENLHPPFRLSLKQTAKLIEIGEGFLLLF